MVVVAEEEEAKAKVAVDKAVVVRAKVAADNVRPLSTGLKSFSPHYMLREGCTQN